MKTMICRVEKSEIILSQKNKEKLKQRKLRIHE